MKYLILFLFPFLINAQKVETVYLSNAFGGIDTIKNLVFYRNTIDTSSMDSTLRTSVYTPYFSSSVYDNVKISELIVDQSGTSDPTYLTVKSDIGTIDITYDAVGTYLLEDRVSSFSSNKTFLFIQNRSATNNYTVDYEYVDADTLRIYTKSNGTLTNGILNKCFIKLVTFK